jgi:hypothetical protein
MMQTIAARRRVNIGDAREAAFAMEALPAAIGTPYARLRTTPGRRIVIVCCSHLRRGSPLLGHRRQLAAVCESADDAVLSGVTGAGDQRDVVGAVP